MSFTQQQKLAFLHLSALCSRTEKCSSEALDKLKTLGLEEDEAIPVLEKLITDQYVNDERFARAYVKDKFRFNRWGRQKIEYMLRQKRIPAGLIASALDEIQEENYSGELKKILLDKAKSVKAKDAFDKRNKLMRFALSRGFESGEIYKALKELDF
jgi:regulatory protein